MPSAAGVIDYFLRPKFRFVTSSTSSPSAIANPVTGRGNALAASVGLASSYGLVCAVSYAPPFAGRTVGTLVTYEDPVLELWVTHTLASGLAVVTQHEKFGDQNRIVLWENLLPSSVLVDVWPNYEATLEWLVGT